MSPFLSAKSTRSFPFFPAFPPRLLNTEPVAPIQTGRSRALNEWILRYASIQANTFPSAHVASCIAASLVLLRYDTLVGAGFVEHCCCRRNAPLSLRGGCHSGNCLSLYPFPPYGMMLKCAIKDRLVLLEHCFIRNHYPDY